MAQLPSRTCRRLIGPCTFCVAGMFGGGGDHQDDYDQVYGEDPLDVTRLCTWFRDGQPEADLRPPSNVTQCVCVGGLRLLLSPPFCLFLSGNKPHDGSFTHEMIGGTPHPAHAP